MKITAGIGTIDDYIPFVQAGADEVFCGYVPAVWMETAGAENPINRREVLYANVQTGSWSEMEILAKMQEEYGVPVTVTLNSPFYDPQHYGMIIKLIRDCRAIGIFSFITADHGLLMAVKRAGISGIHLHISGEAGEANRYSAQMAREYGADRIIFGRKTTIRDMAEIIAHDKERFPQRTLEAEAFMLNEMCHFSGGFCSTYHCDAFAPMCRVPYILGDMKGQAGAVAENDAEEDVEAYMPGQSGCGLCALWDLREAGITHLKVVSRGNYQEDTIMDIQALVKARECLETAESREAFVHNMKRALFAGRCSGNCYYRSESNS